MNFGYSGLGYQAEDVTVGGSVLSYFGNDNATTVQLLGNYGKLLFNSTASYFMEAQGGGSYYEVLTATGSSTKIYVHGTQYIGLESSYIYCYKTLLPSGTVNIGSSGTRFNNCYLDGTLYVATEISAVLISMGFSGAATRYIQKDSTHRFIGCYYDGTHTYGQLFYDNTAKVAAIAAGASVAGNVLATGTLFLQERASADSDIAGWGQLWIKNATPCELWFTDDAGTDTKIV